jgi:hypothetical protein
MREVSPSPVTSQVTVVVDRSGTGHMPQIERAEAFSQVVGNFWATASRGDGR